MLRDIIDVKNHKVTEVKTETLKFIYGLNTFILKMKKFNPTAYCLLPRTTQLERRNWE